MEPMLYCFEDPLNIRSISHLCLYPNCFDGPISILLSNSSINGCQWTFDVYIHQWVFIFYLCCSNLKKHPVPGPHRSPWWSLTTSRCVRFHTTKVAREKSLVSGTRWNQRRSTCGDITHLPSSDKKSCLLYLSFKPYSHIVYTLMSGKELTHYLRVINSPWHTFSSQVIPRVWTFMA